MHLLVQTQGIRLHVQKSTEKLGDDAEHGAGAAL